MKRNPRPIPLDMKSIDHLVGKLYAQVRKACLRHRRGGTLPEPYAIFAADELRITNPKGETRDIGVLLLAGIDRSESSWIYFSGGIFRAEQYRIELNLQRKRVIEGLGKPKLVEADMEPRHFRSELKEMVLHELTHAAEPIWRQPQYARFGHTMEEHANDPQEVRAFGQQIVAEVLDEDIDQRREQLDLLQSKGIRAHKRFVEALTECSKTWAQRGKYMSVENQRRILLMVERALRDVGVDTQGRGKPNPAHTHRPHVLYPAKGVARCGKRNPALPAEELQDELLNVLHTPDGGIDGNDFLYLVTEYLETQGEEPLEYDESLWLDDSNNKHAFEKWLLATNQIDKEMRDVPADIPAYYWFEEPFPLDPGTWLIHHSDSSFSSIERGTTWETIAFTWAAREPVKAGSGNLDDDSMYDRVYAFAFPLDEDECITHRAPEGKFRCAGRRPKYGSNLLLFQCDAAVSAYHKGDQETQAIFPVGAQYNEHRLVGDSDGSWWVEDPRNHEDVNLPTIDAVIEFLSKPVRKRRGKRNPLHTDMVTLYHGTSSELLPNIQANGLVTEDWVYLATTRKEAMGWARERVGNLQWRNLPAGTPVVLKVRVPKASLEQGLEGIFNHRGSVPASAIVASKNRVPFKTCGCGRVYDEAGWNTLPLCATTANPDGRMTFPWGEVQEMRNCPCGSTIVVVVEEGEKENPVKPTDPDEAEFIEKVRTWDRASRLRTLRAAGFTGLTKSTDEELLDALVYLRRRNQQNQSMGIKATVPQKPWSDNRRRNPAKKSLEPIILSDLKALADRVYAAGIQRYFGARDVLAWMVGNKPRLGLRGPALSIENHVLVYDRRMLANSNHWLDIQIQRAFFPDDAVTAQRGEGIRGGRGQRLDEPDAEVSEVLTAMERLLAEAITGDPDKNATVVLMPDLGEPHVPGQPETPYYSAKTKKVVVGHEPAGTTLGEMDPAEALSEGVEAFAPGGEAYMVDLCRFAKTVDPGPTDRELIGVFKDGLRVMVTHSFDPTGSDIAQDADGIVRCAGLIYPSLSVGPIPAVNFGKASLIGLVPPVIQRLRPYADKKRGAYELVVYDTDAWTGRTKTMLERGGTILWAQLTGNWSPRPYGEYHMWSLGPAITEGPASAKLVRDTKGLHAVIKRITRAWKRGSSHSEIQGHIDAESKSYYGYGEVKAHGVYPLTAFPVCVASADVAAQAKSFLKQVGWSGDMIVLPKKNPDINADLLEHAWQISDAVYEYADKHRRIMLIAR